MMQLAVLICLTLVVNTFADRCVQDSDCGNDDQCCLSSRCATKPGEGNVCGGIRRRCPCKSGLQCSNANGLGTCLNSSSISTSTTPNP
uniref:U23-Hexatoxin-Hf1d_1 n=1 Tax=Hadronyche formidabilis TaxID=426499 RepID=A0A4Q8KAL3_HADFO